MDRRTFLQTLAAAVAAARVSRGADGKRPQVLLRSSWQTVNIGDIAHTPGVLTLLEKHAPGIDVRLWPSDVGNGVEEMLRRRFPKLEIVRGKEAVARALGECDFLLHGSGPSLVAAKDVARWKKETGKPYGVFGITCSDTSAGSVELLSGAAFVYFRDSVSLGRMKEAGVTSPVMEFGPDGAFAVDLEDEPRARAFLKEHGLEPGRFLCCIPRLRYTPYWKIKDRPFDEKKHLRSEAMKEHDHAPLREAIAAVVRQTDCKVLLCPEDKSQMEVGRELLYDKLPEDVRAKVVWRKDYWLTDEAVSTYRLSAGLFGLEMHSPIMCVGNGIPAIVGRFEEQTTKGFMWRDIGLGEWLFDMDRPDEVARLVPTVLSLAQDPEAAKQKVAKARAFVEQRQRAMVAAVAEQGAKIK